MTIRSIAIAVLAGCAQLFGIDTTTSPDAAAPGVSLNLRRVSVGATLVYGPLDLAGQSATFLLADGTKVAGMVTASGTWTAPVPTGTPAVEFTVPDLGATFPRVLELPSRTLRDNFYLPEHPNPQPPSATSQLMVDVTLPSTYAAAERLELSVIGAWMSHVLSAAELPGVGATTVATTIRYASFSPFAGGAPARIRADDAVLLSRYVGTALTGVFQTAFDQTDATDPVAGAMTAVMADKTLSATVDPTGLAMRYTAVNPRVSGLAMSWGLTAAPGHAAGAISGPTLESGSVAMVETSITRPYANPFESLGWPTVLGYYTSETRTYMFMGVAMTLYAGLYSILEPGAANTLDLPAALPQTISIAQQPLTSDGMTVSLDLTRPVDVTFVADVAVNTTYELVLYELVLVGPTAKTQVVIDVRGTDPKLALPSELIQVGHTYMIRLYTLKGGYGNATTGDLQTLTLPYSSGYLDSGVFTVTP